MRENSARVHGETWEVGALDVDAIAFNIHLGTVLSS